MCLFETLCTSPKRIIELRRYAIPDLVQNSKSQTATHVHTSCHMCTALDIIIIVIVYMQKLPREFFINR